MEQRERGRPIEFTDEVVRKLEEVFSLDGTVEEACFYAGISRDTYYKHIKKKPELSYRFEELRNRPILKARQEVVKRIGESYQNAMDYLKRKRKQEFSERTEITGKEGQPLYLPSEIINKNNLNEQ